jgi:excisionase family DNA binding protein
MSTRPPRHHRRPDPPGPGAAASVPVMNPAATLDSQPEPDTATERLAYSVDEAARLTGLSRDLLYDQMRCGNLPYLKVGRRRIITRHHLRQFLGLATQPAPYQATAPAQKRHP